MNHWGWLYRCSSYIHSVVQSQLGCLLSGWPCHALTIECKIFINLLPFIWNSLKASTTKNLINDLYHATTLLIWLRPPPPPPPLKLPNIWDWTTKGSHQWSIPFGGSRVASSWLEWTIRAYTELPVISENCNFCCLDRDLHIVMRTNSSLWSIPGMGTFMFCFWLSLEWYDRGISSSEKWYLWRWESSFYN